MLIHDVQFWNIRNKNAKTNGREKPKRKWSKPYELRWRVGTESQSKTFLTRALADDFRADLLKAAQRGELFDTETGLPGSMLRSGKDEDSRHWFEFARAYTKERWPGASAKSRESIVDSLAVATLALLDGPAVQLDRKLVRAATRWAFIPRRVDAESPEHLRTALRLLEKGTRRLSELTEPEVVRALLKEFDTTVLGGRAAPTTASRRRRTVNAALEYAVELGDLDENPLQRKEYKRKSVVRSTAIDRRVVVNPDQAREFLTAVSYVGSWGRARGRRLVAFYATMYYAGVRPAEARGLRLADCELPETGWGYLHLQQSRPVSGKQWTDNGTIHDDRGLKQREEGSVRPVPVPPVLVSMIKGHIEEFGVAEDGRLFANERGGILGDTTVLRVFKEARHYAFAPHQVASPLASHPYDLRHAALSTWLNAGVDPTDVAERAGNSVEVLLKTYAKCLDGQQERNNKLIDRILGLTVDDASKPESGGPER